MFEHFGNITFPSKQLLLAQINSNRMDQKWKRMEMMAKTRNGGSWTELDPCLYPPCPPQQTLGPVAVRGVRNLPCQRRVRVATAGEAIGRSAPPSAAPHCSTSARDDLHRPPLATRRDPPRPHAAPSPLPSSCSTAHRGHRTHASST